MKIMRKFLTSVVIMVCIFMVGCKSSSSVDQSVQEDAEEYIVVGFSQLGAESDWRSANTESMKSAFTEENGYQLLFEDGQQKQANQIMAIRTFIQQEVDYIVLAPVTETGWDTVLQEAKEAEIPVIIVDRKVDVSDEDLFTCWVGSDFELEGKKAAEWLNQYTIAKEIAPSDIHIVNIQGTIGASAQIGRTNSLAEAAEKNGWDLLAEVTGDFTQAKGKEVMESFLKEYDNINVVYCENDNEALGAIEAIHAAGKKVGSDITSGEIMVISFDGVNEEAMRYILEDKITCIAECNPLHGPRVQAIIEMLEEGKEPDKFSYVDEEIFSADKTVKKLSVDGTEYDVTILMPQAESIISVSLSDEIITVDGMEISENKEDAIYAGEDIIYYEEGRDKTYGEGDKKDAHSVQEAQEHTVLTITQPGTYEVSGKISHGQIAIDLGEDSRKDEDAVVNLILNNAEIHCSVAPAIVVYNAYECGSKSKKDANPIVDTQDAGFQLILAKDSENLIYGSYVAVIYEDGTTQKDIKNKDAKKKYKFDAAIDSLVSFNIDSGENGRLIVNGENEGISSGLHLTVNNGEIIINAGDDSVNTNKDDVSVFTMNGGILICNSGFGDEGDGIDSNGYIVINGGIIRAYANPESIDSGVDSDKGIFLNGGTLFATGNMYDEVSEDSGQSFMVLDFNRKIKKNDLIMMTDDKENPIVAFCAVNDFQIAVYSSPELMEGEYHFYKVSSVTGSLEKGIYTDISNYEDKEKLLNISS